MNNAINKTIYEKLVRVIPDFKKRLAEAQLHPSINKPMRMAAGLNLHYLRTDEEGNHVLALTRLSGNETLEFKENIIIRIPPEGKSAEVFALQNEGFALPSYMLNDGEIERAPLYQYLNEYLEMKLDGYAERGISLDFSKPMNQERGQNHVPNADELDGLREERNGKSNDKGINR